LSCCSICAVRALIAAGWLSSTGGSWQVSDRSDGHGVTRVTCRVLQATSARCKSCRWRKEPVGQWASLRPTTTAARTLERHSQLKHDAHLMCHCRLCHTVIAACPAPGASCSGLPVACGRPSQSHRTSQALSPT